MVRSYDLTLGLPHTNRRGLWEPLLLQYAGHFHWQTIASAIGRPLSELRTVSGAEVYAAFYFIEETVPESAPIESFGLDDALRFTVALRAFKNMAVEGQVLFNQAGALRADTTGRGGQEHPHIRFGSIFITPERGNRELRVAPPANADFSAIPALPNDENPYHITRVARDTGSLGLFEEGWTVHGEPFDYSYQIDRDRDTNGAGLVYFANYIAFAEACERHLIRDRALPAGERSVRHRRTAYYGNAEIDDTIRVRASVFVNPDRPSQSGHRYTITRQQDDQLICVSEVVKAVSLSGTIS